MKKHKVDPDNLPSEEVLAISITGNMLSGRLEIFYNRIDCYRDDEVLTTVTHYILKQDLLDLKEE